jgi:hypothetical protein
VCFAATWSRSWEQSGEVKQVAIGLAMAVGGLGLSIFGIVSLSRSGESLVAGLGVTGGGVLLLAMGTTVLLAPLVRMSAPALILGALLVALGYGILFTGLGLGYHDHDLLSVRTTVFCVVGVLVAVPGILLLRDELGLD